MDVTAPAPASGPVPTRRLQLTFVPGQLVPAAGAFRLWGPADGLAHQADALRLPPGEPAGLATVDVADGDLVARDLPARSAAVLPMTRALMTLPPGSDWPSWSRPSPSVLAWSAAAKYALELVAAGRLLPGLRPADTLEPTEAVEEQGGRPLVNAAYALWRAVPGEDGRLERLAEALPVAAHAVRRPDGDIWPAAALLRSFVDAVADACARAGQRPTLDARRRGHRQPWPRMWATALTGSDPTIAHLRVRVADLAEEVDAWSAPLLARDEHAGARLAVRLEAPEPTRRHGDAELATGPWRLHYLLQDADDPDVAVPAGTVWGAGGGAVELGPRVLADAETRLVTGLATAARMFPPIDRSLSQAQPTALDLDAEEASAFLAEGATSLGAAGIGVLVPPELGDLDESRLRLRLRIGQEVPAAGRVRDLGDVALSTLTDATYELALGAETISASELAEVVALGQPLVRWRGTWVRVEPDQLDAVRELAGRSASLELTEALAAALVGQHHHADLGWISTVPEGQLAALLERLRGTDAPGEATVLGIHGQLRPYQERGVAWLQRLTGLGMGAVLADEMGLGKTLAAITLITSRPADRPHLVVCPTSVVGNWQRELHRFAPGLRVIRHHGPEREQRRSAFLPGQVVLTSYALLRRDQGLLEDIRWDTLVLDEAQQIKNPASKGARAARALEARARVAMTGTPIENRLSELWAIVDVTNPGLLGSQRAFNERFAVPIERWHDETAATRLRRLTAPFVLRRRKDDPEVSVDLPSKQEITVACTLTREQASLYRGALEEAFSGSGLGSSAFERRGRILALLTRLKQICNHPAHFLGDGSRLPRRSGKLARATEILGEIVDAGDHALVFTQFRQMGHLLVDHLTDELDLPEVAFLHGGVPAGRRDTMVRRFQEDDDAPPLLVISLRAGGTGLNLTRATEVVHFDRWWNPAVEDQATDRVHRIGQTRPVTVHRLVTAGTLEDRIDSLLERKRALADAVVGTGETWITELDDDELGELVALSTGEIADDADGDEAEPSRGRLRVVADR